MAGRYLDLALDDRREVLNVAASTSGRPVYLLENDIWVVWSLQTLLGNPLGAPLLFKGGTSLSKAWKAIRLFSEDVDLTYDVRVLAPDLVGDSLDPLPASRSQEKRWTSELRGRLAAWNRDLAAPFFANALHAAGLDGEVSVENAELFIRYVPLEAGSGYVRPEVRLEFGARATGEPSAQMWIDCDAAPHVPNVIFPRAKPRVMQVERTFWEKGDGGACLLLAGTPARRSVRTPLVRSGRPRPCRRGGTRLGESRDRGSRRGAQGRVLSRKGCVGKLGGLPGGCGGRFGARPGRPAACRLGG